MLREALKRFPDGIPKLDPVEVRFSVCGLQRIELSRRLSLFVFFEFARARNLADLLIRMP